MLHLLTVCALYVCLCDYVNVCMYLVLLCIFGKKLLRACVYCLQKPNSNKVFLSYLILSNDISCCGVLIVRCCLSTDMGPSKEVCFR